MSSENESQVLGRSPFDRLCSFVATSLHLARRHSDATVSLEPLFEKDLDHFDGLTTPERLALFQHVIDEPPKNSEDAARVLSLAAYALEDFILPVRRLAVRAVAHLRPQLVQPEAFFSFIESALDLTEVENRMTALNVLAYCPKPWRPLCPSSVYYRLGEAVLFAPFRKEAENTLHSLLDKVPHNPAITLRLYALFYTHASYSKPEIYTQAQRWMRILETMDPTVRSRAEAQREAFTAEMRSCAPVNPKKGVAVALTHERG